MSRQRTGAKRHPVDPGATMPFLEHLRELRRRLIVSLLAVCVGAVVSFVFFDSIIALLFRPFAGLPANTGDQTLYINTIFEGFLIKIKVVLLSGLILSLPVHLYNGVKFVFPGLSASEKRVVAIALAASFTLLIVSSYYGYFKVIPISVRFLTAAGFIPDNVGLLLNYGRNVFYIFQFLLVTVVLFQLPILIEILMILNLVQRKTLVRASRFVVVGVFVLSAILTPPDFVSQLSLALPLVALYFLAILIARIFHFGEE